MFDKRKGSKQGSPQIKESIAIREDPPVAAQARSSAGNLAVIGLGIEITGEVTSSTAMRIDGQIKGSIVESSHDVEVGELGIVSANISAKKVTISGTVEGNIAGKEKVLISKTGKVKGNIIAPRVQLEDGALFRGSIEMNPVKVEKPNSPAVSKNIGSSGRAGSSIKVSGNGAGRASVKGSERKEPGLTLKSG
jgi:cytoskeletal protein CcmA (bactofilin family)